MTYTPRIGIQLAHSEPYWVQVREAIWQQARSRSAEIVESPIPEQQLLSVDEQIELVEDLLVQDLDAVIGNRYSDELLARLLERGLPVVYLPEHALRHPRFTSRTGLYEAARLLGGFVNGRLRDGAQIVVVGGPGGGPALGEDDGDASGLSRVEGFVAGLPAGRLAALHRIPCNWSYEAARRRVEEHLAAHPDLPVDALFGLSDTLALAARDACRARGRLREGALIVGVNGDPLALAAISAGELTATVEIDLDDLAAQALELALRAARGEALPPVFACQQRLVTLENVAEAATRKLISMAGLPTRLIEENRHHEQQRTLQVETSAAIDRKVGLLLDEQQLAAAITSLIRDSYGFDQARLLRLERATGRLMLTGAPRGGAEAAPDGDDQAGPLAYARAHNQLVFIPDTLASNRFAPDPLWPEARARVVVPVRLGGQLVGLLDLHRRAVTHHTREELAGLQLLADRIGISVRNAQLYSQEQEARAVAEQADRLKTALLANVSHELRAPLNIILGYSRGALDALARGAPSPAEQAEDLAQIYHSGEHLLRLINDLLDLSRAEIGELDLLPERVDTRALLEEVFRSSAASFGKPGVAWRLALPPALPALDADPVRLRQILLNLLHNAQKFTAAGTITLGAEVVGAELHLWVADSGPGISPEKHEQIFEPFISSDPTGRRHEGIGLGLNITRRLVHLHRGRLGVESAPGSGSTFHISLPLPTAAEAASAEARRVLLLISEGSPLPEPIVQLAERRGLALQLLRSNDNLSSALQSVRPALLAWDVSTAGADGWRLVEEIQARPELRQLPVMIYSGAVDAALDTGGATTGILLKPLGDSALLEALSDLDPRRPDGSILIVEDDPHVRALHRRLLAQHFPGYSIRDAGDGRAALDAVAAQLPSLILLDLILPELDGFAVLEALRADRRTAAVPVLVLSGKMLMGDDIRRLSEARVIFHTKEMLSADELAASLRRALEGDERLPLHTSALVKQAIAFVQQHHAEALSRQAIADAIGVHKDYLGRIFQQELGLSPWEYLIRYRVLRARRLLLETDLTIAEVAARVGFDTPTYFSQVFNREVGCTPRAYRARGGA